MPRLLIAPESDVPPPLRWQALAYLRVDWPDDFTGAHRFPLTRYPPDWRPVHVALTEGDHLLAHAAVIQRTIDHVGHAYRVAGLGCVFTFPSCRGRGYGGQVVGAATELIRASEADVAALFCPASLSGFYGRQGWEPCPDAVTTLGAVGAPQIYPELRMMLFLTAHGEAVRRTFACEPWHVGEAW